jgi:hypothetical protein
MGIYRSPSPPVGIPVRSSIVEDGQLCHTPAGLYGKAVFSETPISEASGSDNFVAFIDDGGDVSLDASDYHDLFEGSRKPLCDHRGTCWQKVCT